MKINESKLKKKYGYEEGWGDAIDKETADKALSYKKDFLKQFISINQTQIEKRLGGQKYWVTLKYDGEYADIFHEGKNTISINRSVRVRRGLPCLIEAGELLEKAGYKEAVVASEIYYYNDGKRSKLGALLKAFANEKETDNLRLAIYDIQELEGKAVSRNNYQEVYDKIVKIFEGGKLCHPVRMEVVDSVQGVKNLYQKWVVEQGMEGLVVRSEMPFVFKIKPRHNIDTVVIGFTEGTGSQKGMVRTMLLALMPAKNRYQILTHVGGGMPDKMKKDLFKKFTKNIIKSEYIETDSNYVAFHMIKPETVMEISVNDVNFEKPDTKIENNVLEIVNGAYKLHSTVEGISVVAPIFETFRDDKKADETDVRLSQVDAIYLREPSEVKEQVRDVAELPKSEILSREVYKKEQGDKIMVQKYVVWKTNKADTGYFPSYVLYYANFSSQRKDPLQREVKVSESLEQINELKDKEIEENVKSGWVKVETENKPKKKRK